MSDYAFVTGINSFLQQFRVVPFPGSRAPTSQKILGGPLWITGAKTVGGMSGLTDHR